jgi:hypothetical protein
MTNSDTLKYRVEQLEKKYDSLDNKLDKIMTNHLPHIELELVKFGTKQKVYTALNIGAIIVGILATKFL